MTVIHAHKWQTWILKSVAPIHSHIPVYSNAIDYVSLLSAFSGLRLYFFEIFQLLQVNPTNQQKPWANFCSSASHRFTFNSKCEKGKPNEEALGRSKQGLNPRPSVNKYKEAQGSACPSANIHVRLLMSSDDRVGLQAIHQAWQPTIRGHVPSGCVAKINTPRPWPWPWGHWGEGWDRSFTFLLSLLTTR